jgi:hypothetical protein
MSKAEEFQKTKEIAGQRVQNKIGVDVAERANTILDLENLPVELFTPKMLDLLSVVGNQLRETTSLENIELLYNKIAEVCKDGNNGTALLALAEAMMSLISTATKPVEEGVLEITE